MKTLVYLDGTAVCPSCWRGWGYPWPPISICPPCLSDKTMAMRPDRFPREGARMFDTDVIASWTEKGWDMSQLEPGIEAKANIIVVERSS